VQDLDPPRHLGRGDEQIFGERRREGLAAVVEDHSLEKGVPEPMRDSAEDLALDDLRMHHLAAIMDEDDARNSHLAGLHIDLDLDDAGSVAIGHVVDDDAFAGFEPGLPVAGKEIARKSRGSAGRSRQG